MERVIVEWMLFGPAALVIIALLVLSAISWRTRAKVGAREDKRLCTVSALVCIIGSITLGIVTLVVHHHWLLTTSLGNR